jgi:hypothetical protein
MQEPEAETSSTLIHGNTLALVETKKRKHDGTLQLVKMEVVSVGSISDDESAVPLATPVDDSVLEDPYQ